MTVIDSDQHLFEHRGLWEEHVDPALRDQALRFVDDPLGHVHLVWRDRVLSVADRREREGLPPAARYDEILPRDYWDPAARAEKLREIGVDEAMLFPKYGLGWERRLGVDPCAQGRRALREGGVAPRDRGDLAKDSTIDGENS